MTNRRMFFRLAAVAPVAAIGAVKAIAGPPSITKMIRWIKRDLIHEGNIRVSLSTPPQLTPEVWLDWLNKNKSGISAAITDVVRSKERGIL